MIMADKIYDAQFRLPELLYIVHQNAGKFLVAYKFAKILLYHVSVSE